MKAGPWAPKDTGNTMNERQATKGNRDVRDYSADNRSMEPVLCPELRLAGHLQKSRRRTREMTASCLCRVLFLITWILLLASVQASAQMDEYDIKAGYLYNFSKYVAWPDGTFATPTAPFVICIVGEDPFGNRLDQAVAGKMAGSGRPLEIRRLTNQEAGVLRQCQIVFIGKSERKRVASVLAALKGSSTFTVADFTPFAEEGGIANLRIDGTKVKVDLNINAANRANLKVSGKLQQVANLVN